MIALVHLKQTTMPKGTFEFDLNDADDVKAFYRAAKSTDVVLALWEILYNTKKGFEWEVESLPEEVSKGDMYDLIEKMYEKFWEVANDHNVNPSELID